jgi:hypothetical protein
MGEISNYNACTLFTSGYGSHYSGDPASDDQDIT